jgi:hypothetical protein
MVVATDGSEVSRSSPEDETDKSNHEHFINSRVAGSLPQAPADSELVSAGFNWERKSAFGLAGAEDYGAE